MSAVIAPLDFAIQLAHQAGELLLEHLDQATISRTKADHSIVTDADLAADRMITREIRENYPDDLILSEELQPQLSGDPSSRLWVIDPLDGTTNYSLGLPLWGISIARLQGGQPELGVLYFPKLNELYSSYRGEGAYYNEAPLQVKPPSPNQPATFFSCCSRTYRNYEIRIRYKPRILGSAAYSLCNVANGRALVAFEATPKIWDLAAAWLLVNEAGGEIDTHHGPQPFPVQAGIDYSQASFPTLAASNRELVNDARQKIIYKGH
jgi:myo-inositol-1(or 4)-monophosphatase